MADGRAGVRDLRKRVFNFRVSPKWYAVALVALPAAAVATAVVLSGPAPIVALASDPMIVVGGLLSAVFAFALVNWWEEAAWTGFVLDRIQPRVGPIRASVFTTWMQAALHLPLVFIAGGVTEGRVAPADVPFYLVALFVLPIAVRMVLTWIYNASGRSVPIAGLYHAGLGVASGVAWIPVIAPDVNPVLVYAGFAVLAAIVLAATRGRLGYRSEDRTVAQPTEVAMATA